MVKKKHAWTIIVRTQGRREDSLIETLYSIVLQSYKNKKVILVLHSKSQERLKKLEDIVKNLRPLLDIEILTSVSSKKRGYPLNVGLDACKSKYVSFLDDDDILYPHAGDVLIREMEKGDLNFVCGEVLSVHQKRIGKLYKNTAKGAIYEKKFNQVELVSTNYIPIHGYIYDFEFFKKLRFDERLDLLEDWDFLLQMIFSGKLKAKYIEAEIGEYRSRDDNSQSFQILKKRVKKSRKFISKKFGDKKLEIGFDDIFKIYPDVNDISPYLEIDSDIGKLRKEVERLRTNLEKRNFQIEKIVTRKGFRIYNKILKLLGRSAY